MEFVSAGSSQMEGTFGRSATMAIPTWSVPLWQVGVIGGLAALLYLAKAVSLETCIRAVVQPQVVKWVHDGTTAVLAVQRLQHPLLGKLVSVVSLLVSIEFYITFLPLLFWVGECRLARQMTLLMAACLYVGNALKDLICAPRPPSPPVVRTTNTESDKEHFQEYGMPSTHAVNMIALSGYILYHYATTQQLDEATYNTMFWLLIATVFMVMFGRMYLGMHSPVDLIGGSFVALGLLWFWTKVDDHVDLWITTGGNAASFQSLLSVMLLYCYPIPEDKTPSFEYHTAFTGVAFGVISAINRTYALLWINQSRLDLYTRAGAALLAKRMLIGLPIVLVCKCASKWIAKRLLPAAASMLGIPLRSSSGTTPLDSPSSSPRKKSNCQNRAAKATCEVDALDVDTGVRFVSYASVGWSVVELIPIVCNALGLW